MDYKTPITMTHAEAVKRAIDAAAEAEGAMRQALKAWPYGGGYRHAGDAPMVKVRVDQAQAAHYAAMAWAAVAGLLPDEPRDWEV